MRVAAPPISSSLSSSTATATLRDHAPPPPPAPPHMTTPLRQFLRLHLHLHRSSPLKNKTIVADRRHADRRLEAVIFVERDQCDLSSSFVFWIAERDRRAEVVEGSLGLWESGNGS
nr:hypothetical protein Itr_chr03CG11530 [Ipomoea trifida]